MQFIASSDAKTRGKPLKNVIGRDPTSIVQEYLHAAVDTKFLQALLPYFNIREPNFLDIEYLVESIDEPPSVRSKDINEIFNIFHSRGYDIKDEKEFLTMLEEYPITNDTARLKILATVADYEMRTNKDDTMTFELPFTVITYELTNWTKKNQPKGRGIYIKDILSLIAFLADSLWKEYLPGLERYFYRRTIVDMKIEDVKYYIDESDGSYILMALNFTINDNRF